MKSYQRLLSAITAYLPKIEQFKPYLVWASIVISCSVLLFPGIHNQFANISWALFIITMLIRPVMVLWPRAQKKWELLRHPVLAIVAIVLRFGMMWRRQLGILTGVFGIAHGAGVLLLTGRGLTDVFSAALWNFGNFWGWGMLALAAMLPPLVTSNNLAVRYLRRGWKWWQLLAYVAFIATGVHIALVENELGPVVPVIVWAVLWVFARHRRKK